jgi:hypothetical protein
MLPRAVSAWVATGDPETYDTESIYAYIDGHAEVYLAYGMQRCVTQRYTSDGGDREIVVDLFEMASPADAFGVFSHDRAGDAVDVGRGGVFRHGWLSFWQGAWYGSVYAVDAGNDVRQDVVAVSRAAAEVLPEGGEIPAIVGQLPAEGLDPSSVCYLRSPQILNAHVFVGAGNPFGLGDETEAVVGAYDLGEDRLHVVVVRYPDAAAARRVVDAARGLSDEQDDRPEMLVGGDDTLVAAVIGDALGEAAEDLLAQVLGGE